MVSYLRWCAVDKKKKASDLVRPSTYLRDARQIMCFTLAVMWLWLLCNGMDVADALSFESFGGSYFGGCVLVFLADMKAFMPVVYRVLYPGSDPVLRMSMVTLACLLSNAWVTTGVRGNASSMQHATSVTPTPNPLPLTIGHTTFALYRPRRWECDVHCCALRARRELGIFLDLPSSGTTRARQACRAGQSIRRYSSGLAVGGGGGGDSPHQLETCLQVRSCVRDLPVFVTLLLFQFLFLSVGALTLGKVRLAAFGIAGGGCLGWSVVICRHDLLCQVLVPSCSGAYIYIYISTCRPCTGRMSREEKETFDVRLSLNTAVMSETGAPSLSGSDTFQNRRVKGCPALRTKSYKNLLGTGKQVGAWSLEPALLSVCVISWHSSFVRESLTEP